MNPYDRIINTLEGKEVDRLPVMDIFHNKELIEYLTGMQITKDNAEDLACEAVKIKLDLCRHFTIPYPDLYKNKIYSDEDGFVLKKNWWTGAYLSRPVKTVEETIHMMEKDIERIKKAAGEHRVISQAQVNLNLPGENCETFEEIEEFFNRIAGKIYPAISICPETEVGMYTALARYGFELFFYAYSDFPEVVLDLYNALTDYEVEKIKTYGKKLKSPIAMLSEAVASNTGLLFSLEFIKKVQYPGIKKVIDAWKEAGKKVIFHADGRKWEILDDIIEMGADSINPCEELAGITVPEFKKRYPGITIGSVVDCQQLLAFGTVEQIKEASWKLVKESENRYVFLGSSSEIHPEIPVTNAMAMYDVLCNYHH